MLGFCKLDHEYNLFQRSLPHFMVPFQRDYFTIGLYNFFCGLFHYEEIIRSHRFLENAYQFLDSMVSFSRFILHVMSEVLPEQEELADEFDNEELPTAVSILVAKLSCTFEMVITSLEKLWAAVDSNFPLDKDTFGSRFSCRENGMLSSIQSLKDTNMHRDLLSNFSELLLMDMLECSFRLIKSCHDLSKGSYFWKRKMQRMLNTEIRRVLRAVSASKAKCEDAVNECEDSFKKYFRKLETSHAELDGIAITMESRFSLEYNLHSNTLALAEIVDHISQILKEIRRHSLNLLVEKSSQKVASASVYKNQLQTLQGELENKICSFLTYTKLEQQLVCKLINNSSAIPPETSLTQPSREEEDAGGDRHEDEDGVLCAKGDSYCLSYETVGKEDILENSGGEILDEFFEMITDRDQPEILSIQHENVTNINEVKQARQVVLEQLKTVLKPRKEAMKAREEEAYKRIYGQPPSKSDEADVAIVQSKKKEQRQALLQELLLQRQKAEENADVFEDDFHSDSESSSEPEPSLFSSDFMNRLDKTLQFGAFRPDD